MEEAVRLDEEAKEKRAEAWESYLRAMEEVEALEEEAFAKRVQAVLAAGRRQEDVDALAKAYRKKGQLIEAYMEDLTGVARSMRAEMRGYFDAAAELCPQLYGERTMILPATIPAEEFASKT
jgi:phage-related tail protein